MYYEIFSVLYDKSIALTCVLWISFILNYNESFRMFRLYRCVFKSLGFIFHLSLIGQRIEIY